MKRLIQLLIASSALALLAGCGTTPKTSVTAPAASTAAAKPTVGRDGVTGQIVGNIAPQSRFAALQIGMSRAEVEQLAGRPTDVAAQSTGTAWVPYYFGSDTWRTENYYKGEGRLVFDANSRLVLIDVSDNARK